MDYAISPRVMGRELEIHPLLAIFTVMVGGAIGGLIGIYLSVPSVAALRVIHSRIVSQSSSAAKLSGAEDRASDKANAISNGFGCPLTEVSRRSP